MRCESLGIAAFRAGSIITTPILGTLNTGNAKDKRMRRLLRMRYAMVAQCACSVALRLYTMGLPLLEVKHHSHLKN
jgi:hypothetical protein